MLRNAGLVVLAGMILAASAAATMAADPSWYAKKGTWQDTMRSAREAKAGVEAEKAPAPAATKAVGGLVKLGPWYQAGPFVGKGDHDFAFAFPPELTPVDVTKPCGDKKWSKQDYADGIVHDLSAPGNAATYLYRTLTAPAPMTINGYFGSDDGIIVFLNGKKVLANDVPRGPAPNQDTAKLSLNEGENTLLLKIFNNSGGHGFYFSTSPNPVGGGVSGTKADPNQIVWDLVGRDFTGGDIQREMKWEREDGIWLDDWKAGDVSALAQRYAAAAKGSQAAKVKELAGATKDAAALAQVRKLYRDGREADEAASLAAGFNFEALRLAIDDLTTTYGDKYPKGKAYLAKLETLQKAIVDAAAAKAKNEAGAADKLTAAGKELVTLRTEALLANPLLAFDQVLCIKRNPKKMGLPANWQGDPSVGANGYDNEIGTFSIAKGTYQTLYRPEKDGFVGDLELHFDADRFLFSMPGTNGRFQIFEMKADGTGQRQVTPGDQKDVDNYSATYLPDGRIMFCSTACYLGVPCVGGADPVGSLYLLNEQNKSIRQLTFDQDHSWYPHVLNSGRVLYTRWEYSDIPHYFSRILFEMNPDGTAQFEYYGSNSYWPNSMFYARPIPNHPSEVAAIISGHHGSARVGEMILFDPAKGRQEASGVVQRVPGYGKDVKPIIGDGIVDGSWPKFLHPYPLSDKYFLVASQPQGNKPWGLYLVDRFDNMLLLCEQPGYAMLEPVPVLKRAMPPAIPDKVKLTEKTATVYLVDVYRGKGLAGVPRGSVKALRVYTNRYAFRGMGGHYETGIDGPWDAKRILGTVPVNEDGSALFKVPANMPIVVEPLDAEGKALQTMRSWYTAMPGEFASCVGCHEPQSASPGPVKTTATGKDPSEIKPWFGPARPFSFEREVQAPVLQKYCVSCHDGAKPGMPDFRAKTEVAQYKGRFTPAYEALHRWVRRPGPESDYHLPMPTEYEANTSELVQMLKKGHHNVKLDDDAWQRLYTWIDMNVPCLGTWTERAGGGAVNANKRMMELAALYGGYTEENTEVYPDMPKAEVKPVVPEPETPAADPKIACARWPFDAAAAKKLQDAAGPAARTVELGPNLKLELVRVPAGEFVMGDWQGAVDERPMAKVKIEKAFWMAKFETTNAEYALFDPTHDSGIISMHNKDQSQRGYPVNGPKQPVVRIPWQAATAYCEWLSKATGEKFTLPTEAQWEWAARAGSATPFSYGDYDTDFTTLANLGDKMLQSLALQGFPPRVPDKPDPILDWVPKDARFNDKNLVTADVGSYLPNVWGLSDMHGNAAEWTRTTYKAYPYNAADGRESVTPEGEKVVRGGSWFDRPKRCTSSFRLAYPSWQGVYNVGFRVMSESDVKATPVVKAK